MTLSWVVAGAAAGLLAGPPIRAVAFAFSTEAGQPPRDTCPACSARVLHGPWRRLWVLPVTGRCPACRTRIRPYPLAAESAASLALAVAAARATSALELAALACLILAAVPLAFTDIAVRRLPDPLTAAAFTGTLAFLTAAALTGHHPGQLARAVIGATALAAFYLLLCLIRPGEMGLGDAKLAASTGLALGWVGWQALFVGTFAGFALAAVYGGALIAAHRATRASQLPLGPFILLGALAALVLLHAAVGSRSRCLFPVSDSRVQRIGGTTMGNLRPCRRLRTFARCLMLPEHQRDPHGDARVRASVARMIAFRSCKCRCTP